MKNDEKCPSKGHQSSDTLPFDLRVTFRTFIFNQPTSPTSENYVCRKV